MLAGCGGESETAYREYEPEAETIADSNSATAEPESPEDNAPTSPAEKTSTASDAGSTADSEQPTASTNEAGSSDSVEMTTNAEEANPASTRDIPRSDAAAAAAADSSLAAGNPAETSGEGNTNSPMLARAEMQNPADPRGLAQDPSEPVEPREPKLLIPNKEFRAEGAENALRVTFDDIDLLKVLNMEPVPEDAVKQFPEWLAQLEGKRVRIRGFMFPTLSQTGITYFQHVRDNEICCFGRTPKVYDRISTVLREGETTNYIQGRPFDVVGTFRIDPVYEDGEWLQLYLLEDAIVFP